MELFQICMNLTEAILDKYRLLISLITRSNLDPNPVEPEAHKANQ
jgi:hypothetical protein